LISNETRQTRREERRSRRGKRERTELDETVELEGRLRFRDALLHLFDLSSKHEAASSLQDVGLEGCV